MGLLQPENDHEYEPDLKDAEMAFLWSWAGWLGVLTSRIEALPLPSVSIVISDGEPKRPTIETTIVQELAKMCRAYVKSEQSAYGRLLCRKGVPYSSSPTIWWKSIKYTAKAHLIEIVEREILFTEMTSAAAIPELPKPSKVPHSKVAAVKTSFEHSDTSPEARPADHRQGDKVTSSEASDASKRGYRTEVRKWMKDNEIETIPRAAECLGVGHDTLKSIMSSRGEKRYSDDTLKDVLTRIRQSTR
jgi:hypothetical protein